MPPLYDNIVDAFLLVQDGVQHTQDFDNTGATMETNESTAFYNFQEVWAKIDLSDPGYVTVYGTAVPISLKSERISGTVIPEVDVIKVDDATFDPSSPDFSKISYGGNFVGDGTAIPPQNDFTLDPAASTTGIFYLWISDWNFNSGEVGVQRLTYTIPAIPVIIDADTSDYNNTSGTVTNLGGGVIKETQVGQFTYASDQRGVFDAVYTFRVSGAQLPPDGRYQLYLLGKINKGSAGSTGLYWKWKAVVRRNEELLLPYSELEWEQTQTRPSTKDVWQMYGTGNYHNTAPKYKDGPGPDTVPVLSGDTFKVIVFNDNFGSSDGSWFEISGLRFVQVEAGGHSVSVDLVTMPRDALGSNAEARIDPTNEPRIPQSDFCVLDNGDIYVVYRSLKNFGSPQYERLRMVKYSGGSWSTIASDLSANAYGNSSLDFGQLSVDTDGTNVYVAWGEPDSGTSKTLQLANGSTASFHPMRWHCKKYSPGSGFIELGTGQNAVPQSSRTYSSSTDGYVPDSGGFNSSIKIKIAPNGIPWVAFGETIDGFFGGSVPPSATNTRVYIWYWDGSAWQDTGFPNHPNIDLVTSTEGAYINYISVDAQHNIDLTFCHHNGPSNYPSVIYSLGSYDTGRSKVDQRFIYREYNGSSWENLIDQLDEEIWPGETLTQVYHPTWHNGSGQQGMSLGDNGIVPIFSAALWNTIYLNDFIKVAKVKPDGSALESYYPGLHSSPDVLFTGERSDVGTSGWTDATGCTMAIDSNGIPWILFITAAPLGSEYGLVLTRPGELGTSDFWIIGSKQNGMMYGEDGIGFSSIRAKDGFIYILGLLQVNGIGEKLAVYKAPIDDTYNAWTLAPGVISILYYFKDGAWHEAGSESDRDLYYFKDGAWHKKGTEFIQTIKARYSESWVD